MGSVFGFVTSDIQKKLDVLIDFMPTNEAYVRLRVRVRVKVRVNE
jgi:hypothetical protein